MIYLWVIVKNDEPSILQIGKSREDSIKLAKSHHEITREKVWVFETGTGKTTLLA